MIRRLFIPVALAAAVLAAAAASAVSTAGPAASVTRVSAAIVAAPSVSGLFLGTLKGRTLTWRLTLRGVAAKRAHVHYGRRGGSDSIAVTLCSACTASERGKAVLSERAAKALAAGATYLDLHSPKRPARLLSAPIVIGVPTLEILSPKDGDTVKLPAEIVYRVTNFEVGDPPHGHMAVVSTASDVRIDIALPAESGTAVLPDVKAALLPGHRDVTFYLAFANHTRVSNLEASVTVRDLVIQGRRSGY